MYTVEFDQAGWAVYHNIRNYMFRITEPMRGDIGKANCTKIARQLNAKTKG